MKDGEHRTTAPVIKGRGTAMNPDNRYHTHTVEAVDDGWHHDAAAEPALRTTLTVDTSRTVISYNSSPDVPFDRSINPYRGCEHGCIYCYARPSHAWLDLSPGLDFETRLLYKPRAATLLRDELAAPSYRCAPVTLGANTDAYQPVERRLGITRGIVEVLNGCHHPLVVITKSALVERDAAILAQMARRSLAQVLISLTTLDKGLARALEPRAAAPQRRLEAISRLSAAGIPVGVLVAPVIPALTDASLESLLEAAREAGATTAGYILLRLPHELGALFEDWLRQHVPLRAAHVMARIRDTHEGRVNDPRFGSRMRGSGPYADVVAQRFRLTARRLGYGEWPRLDCSRFTPPPVAGAQLALL
jgi:DNA repair photolyase